MRRRPEDSVFKMMTLLPLCTPASRTATVPGVKLGLTRLACLEKKFLELLEAFLRR